MLVKTDQDIELALKILKEADTIAVDTETNGLHWERGRKMIGIATTCEGFPGLPWSFYWPFHHKSMLDNFNLDIAVLEMLKPVLNDDDKTYIYWHAKFDLDVLERVGFEIPLNWQDAQIAAHVVDENRFNYRLKPMARDVLGRETNEDKLTALVDLLGGYEFVPPAGMAVYACEDGIFTFELWDHYYPHLLGQSLLEYYQELRPYSEAIREIEATGLAVDRESLQDAALIARTEQALIVERLGFVPTKRLALAAWLDEKGIIYPRTLKGNPNLNEAFFDTLQDFPEAADVIRYRKLDKAASTYFESWLEKLDSKGRLHTTFKLHGTTTGRLSSEQPNLQQVPRDDYDPPVKVHFRAAEGYQLWEFDYSQMELRLAGAYAREPDFISSFREGHDLHKRTADSLGITRYAGKTLNFSIVYGGGRPTLSRQLGIPEGEWDINKRGTPGSAAELLDRFKELYPNIFSAIHKATAAANRNGYIKTWAGRRRHFTHYTQHRKAFNALIQGGCADIFRVSLLNIMGDEAFQGRVCSLIHDAYLIEIPEELIEETQKLVISHMCDWATEGFGVPFTAESKRYA